MAVRGRVIQAPLLGLHFLQSLNKKKKRFEELLEEFKSDPKKNFLESRDSHRNGLLNGTVACSSEVISLIMRTLSSLKWLCLKPFEADEALNWPLLANLSLPSLRCLLEEGQSRLHWHRTLGPHKGLPVGQCPGWCLESRWATIKKSDGSILYSFAQ